MTCKNCEYLSRKLHHVRYLLEEESKRSENAEDDLETLAWLATKSVQMMTEGPSVSLEEFVEKHGI
jgi:hypothetical protein